MKPKRGLPQSVRLSEWLGLRPRPPELHGSTMSPLFPTRAASTTSPLRNGIVHMPAAVGTLVWTGFHPSHVLKNEGDLQ